MESPPAPLKADINLAADTLLELQVETYGSMDRREKTDFILEQMRLTAEKGDWVRVAIVSKKINHKFFDDEAQSVSHGIDFRL